MNTIGFAVFARPMALIRSLVQPKGWTTCFQNQKKKIKRKILIWCIAEAKASRLSCTSTSQTGQTEIATIRNRNVTVNNRLSPVSRVRICYMHMHIHYTYILQYTINRLLVVAAELHSKQLPHPPVFIHCLLFLLSVYVRLLAVLCMQYITTQLT